MASATPILYDLYTDDTPEHGPAGLLGLPAVPASTPSMVTASGQSSGTSSSQHLSRGRNGPQLRTPSRGKSRRSSSRARHLTPPVPRSDDVWAEQVRDLSNRLRTSELQVQHILERGKQEHTLVVMEEECMKAAFADWSSNAKDEISSLLNSFHKSSMGEI